MKKITNKLNNFILKLNRPAFVTLIFSYLIILVVIIFVATPKKDFIMVPEYGHEEYAEEIVPQITIVGIRSFDDNNIESLRYSVSAKLSGRLNQDNNDPKLEIQRFNMSALLENNKMYYFTEQTNRKTPISHSYTMISTATEKNVPDKMFIKLLYKDVDGKEKAATFLEDILLNLTDKAKYTSRNIITHLDKSTNKTVTDLDLKFIATESDSKGYNVSVWIDVKNITQKYHVDMQTWIVTEDGRELPFMGVYGYSDQKNTFFLSNREVHGNLKPKDLYANLVFYAEVDGVMERSFITYKESFENLPEKYTSSPTVPVEDSNDKTENNNDKWIIIGVASFVGIGAAMGLTLVFVKKRNKLK